ncbi:hypothetical protein V2J09_006653 [Rumex salicifolius]
MWLVFVLHVSSHSRISNAPGFHSGFGAAFRFRLRYKQNPFPQFPLLPLSYTQHSSLSYSLPFPPFLRLAFSVSARSLRFSPSYFAIPPLMDEEKEQNKPVLASGPIIHGYSIDESRSELNSRPYFHENLGKGLGSGDASSLFYNGPKFDRGGLGSSAFVEGKDVYKDLNMDKVLTDDGAIDLFSSIGVSNASEDLCWDFDFTKKFSSMDYQFPQVSDSWNSTLVSQSCWSNSKAVGVPESSSQNINFQNNQPERLMTYDVGGNYMTSFAWDMPMIDKIGVNPSYPCDPQFIDGVKYTASPLDTSKLYHFTNNGYFGTSNANNLMMAPSTSLSLQHCDASLLGEAAKGVDHSLQAVAINKPAYNLLDFSEVSPMDTSESYHCSNEGYFCTSHDLNHLAAPSSSLSVQLTDVNIKPDDHSLLSVLLNMPKFSSDPQQDLSEANPLLNTSKSNDCSNERNVGASHEPQDLSETSPVDGGTEADHHTLQWVSVNYPTDSSNVQDIGQGNVAASPMESRDSQNGSNEGYSGTVRELNLLGMSYNSMFMQFTDPSLVDEETTEADDPLWQDLLASKEPISVLSPVDTGESHDHSSENVATSNNFDGNLQGLSCDSIFLQETEVSPMVEDTEEDDPSLISMLVNKPAKCKKVGPHRQKRVLKPLRRCSNGSPAIKTRRTRGRREEPSNSSKRGRKDEPTNKCHGKRENDGAMLAHDAVTRRSGKETLDSDDEYDPMHSNKKAVRSKRGTSGRKNNRLWTLSEVTNLVDGVSEFGVGKWTAIQRTFPGSPPCRSSLDIRDKWRNLIRTSGLRLKIMAEDEFSPKYGSLQLPKILLEKICELDRAQPYLRSEVTPPLNCGDGLVGSSSE